MTQLFSNNASSTLSVGIDNVTTSISVQTGDGALFQAPTGIEYELLTISEGLTVEIVKVTNKTIDTFTVVRGHESTTPSSFTTAAVIEGRITAESLTNLKTDITGSGTDSVSIGDLSTSTGTSSVSIGKSAAATANNTTSLGLSASSSGDGAIAVGRFTVASNLNSTAIGAYSQAPGFAALALGKSAKADATSAIAFSGSHSLQNNQVITAAVTPAMIHSVNYEHGYEAGQQGGFSGLLSSGVIDLSGGVAWTPSTAIRHGTAVHPVAGNVGRQYIRQDWNFSKDDVAGYTISNSGASEPTWPTVFQDMIDDPTSDYVCVPEDGSFVIALPTDLVIEEVMFVCYNASGVTVQANISIGTTGNLTKVLNNQATVGLTANDTVVKWTLSQPVMVPDITIKLDTKATATQMLGRFIFKGFYSSLSNGG